MVISIIESYSFTVEACNDGGDIMLTKSLPQIKYVIRVCFRYIYIQLHTGLAYGSHITSNTTTVESIYPIDTDSIMEAGHTLTFVNVCAGCCIKMYNT